jgi:Tfp pilus assembly protein PilN
MIRINLLASGGGAVRRELIPAAQRPALLGMAFLLCAMAGVAGWWWQIGRQTATLDVQVSQTEQELSRLRAAAKLVDRAIARKSELAEKLALIERLRSAQRGPVTLLSTINRSLPEGLWLMELNQRGAAMQLEGRATSLTAVTDFVERLQGSGAFDRPVEIVTTSMETLEESTVVRFAVKAQAVGTAAAAAAAAAQQTKKGD